MNDSVLLSTADSEWFATVFKFGHIKNFRKDIDVIESVLKIIDFMQIGSAAFWNAILKTNNPIIINSIVILWGIAQSLL